MVNRKDQTALSNWNFLQPGTILDKYMIERPLADGGFSSVYLARQLSDQHQVVIKEYLPRRIAHRTWGNVVVPKTEENRGMFLKGRRLFIEEAKVLAKLKHPNIIEVINFFQQNSTVYIVMTFDYGKNLASCIKGKKGNLNEDFLLTVFPKLLSGIETIHSNSLLHLDIKPENILIRPGDNPVLLDFGAVHPFPNGQENKLGKVLTQGFSPPEQYGSQNNIGPWSDIYAIGASMRNCIEGTPPPRASDRATNDTLVPAVTAFKRQYSRKTLEAIDWALVLDPTARPQSVQDLLGALPST